MTADTIDHAHVTNSHLFNKIARFAKIGAVRKIPVTKGRTLFFSTLSLILKPLTPPFQPPRTQPPHTCLLHLNQEGKCAHRLIREQAHQGEVDASFPQRNYLSLKPEPGKWFRLVKSLWPSAKTVQLEPFWVVRHPSASAVRAIGNGSQMCLLLC